MRNLVALAAALALLLPLAGALPASLDVTTSDPLDLEGATEIHGVGGGFRIELTTAARTLDVVDGTIDVYTYNRTNATIPIVAFHLPPEMPPPQTYTVARGKITLEGDAAGTFVGVAGEGGVAVVRTDLAMHGVPRWVEPRTASLLPDRPDLVPGEPDLAMPWQVGWPLFGRSVGSGPIFGFPEDARALGLQGAWTLKAASGGVLRFLTADGEPVVVSLGSTPVTPTVDAPAGARVETTRLAILHLNLSDASIALGPRWALAMPTATWSVRGDLRLTNATGSLEGRVVDRGTIEGVGRFDLVPRQGAVLAAPGLSGRGDWDRLVVDGDTLGGSPQPTRAIVADGAGLGGAALLLLLLTRAGQEALARSAVAMLYTRLAPEDILGHPTRRRIHAEVVARPGVHAREVHRMVGGAWGAFSFHLRVLERAGAVCIHRDGKFTALYPAQAGPPRTLPLRSETARRLLEALPKDGTPIEARSLQAHLKLPRPLVHYHLHALVKRGLARREPRQGRVAIYARDPGAR